MTNHNNQNTGTDCEIIAEAGVNHNGSLDLALQLVEAAAKAGADVVKFQTFSADALVNRHAPMADYQQRNLNNKQSQWEMLKNLELSYADYRELLLACQEQQIEFMSSPFDRDSLRFLTDELDVRRLKIASGEITNGPLLLDFARSDCHLILSTGMSTLDDIQLSLSILAYGLLEPNKQPKRKQEFLEAFTSTQSQKLLNDKVTLLHCTSQYPTPVEQVNLRAIQTLRDKFSLNVGFSDHTSGITIPIAAAALGATIIEKHFTLDQHLAGPDHKASLEPKQLQQMVTAIRDVSKAQGSEQKKLQYCEQNTHGLARKSLIAACNINAGEQLTTDNIAIQRPGTGISPMLYWEYLSKPAKRSYLKGELLDE